MKKEGTRLIREVKKVALVEVEEEMVAATVVAAVEVTAVVVISSRMDDSGHVQYMYKQRK